MIIDALKAIGNLGDAEFESLTRLLTLIVSQKLHYSKTILTEIVEICCKINAPSFQEQQVWLAITYQADLC